MLGGVWLLALLGADVVPPSLDDSTIVTLERSPCFWRCPQYKVTLYGSGRVEFEGLRYVCAKGTRTARTDPFAVRNLVARLVAGRYLDLSWVQGPSATDAPIVTSSLQYAGRLRVIRHDHGDSGAPRVLDEWEEQIDETARTARWLPERKRDQPVCRREDGRVEPLTE